VSGTLSQDQFVELMQRVARAWSEQDAATAVSCFTADAVYMQPPDVQLYTGRQELTAYFGAISPDTSLSFHKVWFDVAEQCGCVEFTFWRKEATEADHGTVVVALRHGLIASWREYVQRGPVDFTRFTAVHGKQWRWHIGNYP
jgi:hypothetical protein